MPGGKLADMSDYKGRLRDGTRVRLRPIRPKDEKLLQDLVAHMSAEDLRMRFFTTMRELPHALAARLSRLDDDRETALLAFVVGSESLLGVARYAAEADKHRAEMAIAVRSDWHRRGLGHLLLDRLIAVARERGIGELIGTVLHQNRPMLQMCREMGFSLAADPEDAGLVRVTRSLSVA
jgi:acetyltransferase